MKKNYIIAIIVVIIVLIGLIIAIEFGLFGQLFHKSEFTLVNDSKVLRDRISLEDAIVVLNSHDLGGLNQGGNYTVHYIHGENIDASGNAKSWILAVKTNQSQFYFEYQDQNAKEYAWNETNISKPILLDKIVMPDQLFTMHRSLINDILGDSGIIRKEIQLDNGIYTLTITKKIPTDYRFDAYSGEIISS